MNRIGVVTFLAQRLRHVPRSVWIAAGFALVLIPVLLLWLLFALVGGAWQAGGTLLGQGREVLQSVLPAELGELARDLPPGGAVEALQGEAQQRLQAGFEHLQSAIPASAEALQQGLTGAAVPAATESLRQLMQQGQATVDQALAPLLGHARPAADVGGEDPPGVSDRADGRGGSGIEAEVR
jgi:hypothetical protein